MNPVRRLIERQVHGLVGFGSGEVDLTRGDAGLFGPGSMVWRVHSDFTSMMVGGVAALLQQMLHPGALAGVWDHSNFRADMRGRLRRTAQFISGTTYGSTPQAEALIARVRKIHDHVHGQLPDGTPYSANDPDLLVWVHVAEVSNFLAAHLRYRRPLSGAEQDRYYAEVATIAERLGARNVPRSRAEIASYLNGIQPYLRADSRTREVAAALVGQPAPSLLAVPIRDATMQAGIDLLPEWAARMHGFALTPAWRRAIRAGVRGAGGVLRWALRDSSARRAHARVASAAPTL